MTKEYFNTLKAGSDVVTLRAQSPYIYENVNRICEFLQESNLVEDSMSIYQKVFLDRFFSLVLDYSNNSTKTEQFSQVLRKFSNLERELYENNKNHKLMFQKWKNREGKSVEVNQDFLFDEEEDEDIGNAYPMKRLKTK
jgi:hypothetical protein